MSIVYRHRDCLLRGLAVMAVLGIIISPGGMVWAQSGAHKLALLVGINKYKYRNIGDLNGAVNDVKNMRRLLVENFGFPDDDEHILTLADEQATRAAILNAFRQHLIARATSRSIVVFHYSGHGSQRRDEENGDETDRYDETIVTHDSGRNPRPNRDITDDELNALLRELTTKTPNVTFIFDSCHSGSATRASGLARSAPRDDRPPPKSQRASVATRGVREGQNDLRPQDASYALISGSRAEELSHEVNVDGQAHGAMTWHLTQQIRRVRGNATYRDVMDLVKARVSEKYPAQHPQLEGRGQDQFVFSDKSQVPAPYVEITKISGDRVTLAAGQVHGVTEGSIYEVYAPAAKSFGADVPSLARVKITDVDITTAVAEVVQGGVTQSRSRAVEREHFWPNIAVGVHIMGLSGSAKLREIKQALAEFKHIKLLDAPRDYDLLIREEGGYIVMEGGDPTPVSPPVSVSEANATNRVVGQIKHWATWFNVLQINNTQADLDVEFELKVAQRAIERDPNKRDVSVTLPEGERFTIEVTNNSDKKLYIAVLDLSNDGSVSVIYPTGTQQEFVAENGGKWRKRLETYVPKERDSVRDVLKLIATTQYADFTFFHQSAVRGGKKLEATRGGGARNPLEELLASAAIGTTRGVKQVEIDDWVTVDRVLEVRR